jgi:hypothetical protein
MRLSKFVSGQIEIGSYAPLDRRLVMLMSEHRFRSGPSDVKSSSEIAAFLPKAHGEDALLLPRSCASRDDMISRTTGSTPSWQHCVAADKTPQPQNRSASSPCRPAPAQPAAACWLKCGRTEPDPIVADRIGEAQRKLAIGRRICAGKME